MQCRRGVRSILQSVEPIANESKSELRVFLTLSIIIIRSLIVRMVIVLQQCVVYFGGQKKVKVGKKAEAEESALHTYFHKTTSEYAQKTLDEPQ